MAPTTRSTRSACRTVICWMFCTQSTVHTVQQYSAQNRPCCTLYCTVRARAGEPNDRIGGPVPPGHAARCTLYNTLCRSGLSVDVCYVGRGVCSLCCTRLSRATRLGIRPPPSLLRRRGCLCCNGVPSIPWRGYLLLLWMLMRARRCTRFRPSRGARGVLFGKSGVAVLGERAGASR